MYFLCMSFYKSFDSFFSISIPTVIKKNSILNPSHVFPHFPSFRSVIKIWKNFLITDKIFTITVDDDVIFSKFWVNTSPSAQHRNFRPIQGKYLLSPSTKIQILKKKHGYKTISALLSKTNSWFSSRKYICK